MRLAVCDVLLVHHDACWCRHVTMSLSSCGAHARWASSVEDVYCAISSAAFDAVLLDIDTLAAASIAGVLTALGRASPAPAVIAWGTAISVAEAFELGQLGVRRLLSTRPSPADAIGLVYDALQTPLLVEPQLRSMVGNVAMEQVVSEVRRVMLEQALGLARGNRSRTARILSVSRQAVQQMVRRRPRLESCTRALAPESDVNDEEVA